MAGGAKKVLALLAGVAVVVAAAFGGAYLIFFRGDNRDAVRLSETGENPSVADPAGTWLIVKGANTFAGYRVREKLADLPAKSDAVGQTPDVEGSMKVDRTAEGYTISALLVEADLRSLKSDKPMRDRKIRTIGLQTERYPTASFAAARPVEVPAATVAGDETTMDVTGDLTIHGVTKRVTIPVVAKVVGEQIEVVGSLSFPMSDYSIDPPNVPPFVSVEPNATMEFKVRLAKRAA